jgi:hypothetical protein
MKIYYAVLFLFSLLITGCSSTYTLRHYSSKDNFYKDFNSSVGSKDLNVILLNDSLVQTKDGGILKNDTLFTKTNVFPVNFIKTVQFKTRLKSTLFGILFGEMGTMIAGGNILANNQSKLDLNSFIRYASIVFLSGGIIGAIAGYYIGWDINYQFN